MRNRYASRVNEIGQRLPGQEAQRRVVQVSALSIEFLLNGRGY